MPNNKRKDTLDEYQYRIFKWVVFISFLHYAYKLLDSEIPITRAIYSILGY
jgi:hypothetical protein